MNTQRLLSIAAAIAVASFLLGRLTAPHGLIDEISRRGDKVASFSGGSIGIDDALEVVPEGATKDQAKGAVEAMIRMRVLAARAEEAKLHLTPQFLSRYAEELAGLYVIERFEKPFQKQLPTDDDVKKFFAENRARLGRVERVRLAHIALAAPKGDAAARAKKRAEALQLLAELRRTRTDEYAFGRSAMTRSDDPATRGTSGELPFMAREEVAQRLGPEVAAAAFEAKTAGVIDAPLETEQGFQLVKVLGREEGREAALEDVRDAIRSRLAADRHEKAIKAFMDGVWADAGIKFDEKALDRLVEEAKKGSKREAKPAAVSR